VRVIERDFFNVTRSDEFTVIPVGDIHLGAAACDEQRFRDTVARITGDKKCWWIGMGDYADFIQRSDPRFDPGVLADWIKMSDLADLSRAQRDRFLDIIKPIASKCLALVCGNHESAIKRHYERDIFYEIVSGVKLLGGWPEDHQLSLGYTGWLNLNFYRSPKRERGCKIKINLHHGHGGGRLAGAKALNMQRRMAFHKADIVIVGHTHDTLILPGAYQDTAGKKVVERKQIGVVSGTFLRSFNQDGPSTYSEVKGYLPMPLAGAEIILRPHAKRQHDRIRVMAT
jgi:hypothetical protein